MNLVINNYVISYIISREKMAVLGCKVLKVRNIETSFMRTSYKHIVIWRRIYVQKIQGKDFEKNDGRWRVSILTFNEKDCFCVSKNYRSFIWLLYLPITKTCLYNFDPLKPHFYIVKLGFTGVYIIFLISAQNIDCGPRWGGSNKYQQSMFWAEIWKISKKFYLKIFIFRW